MFRLKSSASRSPIRLSRSLQDAATAPSIAPRTMTAVSRYRAGNENERGKRLERPESSSWLARMKKDTG
jgi:hypothetical protein